MPGSPSTSFIPKHTSNKVERKNTPRQLFIGTIVVRVFFFAVLIAAVGVFVYERKLGSELSVEVKAFKTATSAFESEESNVQHVLSMDRRLIQANDRFDNSLSMVAILDAVDRSTVRTVELEKLDIEKKSDTEIVMTAEVVTDTFDSVMFQRSIYEADELLSITNFEEVSVNQGSSAAVPTTPGNLSIVAGTDDVPTVSFKATIQVDPKLVPAVMERSYKAPVAQTTPVIVMPTESISTTSSTSTGSGVVANPENS